VDIASVASIDLVQQRRRRCSRMQLAAEASSIVSVVTRNGILSRSRVHRATSIGGHFQGHHPL